MAYSPPPDPNSPIQSAVFLCSDYAEPRTGSVLFTGIRGISLEEFLEDVNLGLLCNNDTLIDHFVLCRIHLTIFQCLIFHYDRYTALNSKTMLPDSIFSRSTISSTSSLLRSLFFRATATRFRAWDANSSTILPSSSLSGPWDASVTMWRPTW
ncbi:uncharacterized protein METZ01_LOCUS170941 [marine metagenome]|uniref:Uncharacterized protein n=1 Tax=marine metagenome TaxID=408172 RepID=A0A382BY05_9ZZZZ